MHDTNDEQPIYRDLAGEGAELRRALAHSCVGLRPPGAISFVPSERDWAAFYQEVFAARIAPHFIAVYQAAAAGQGDRVVALNERFASGQTEREAKRSAPAAATVFEARAGAGAMRPLGRLKEGRKAPAFASAFAAHTASFHVPLLHALIAYLAVEWRAGHAGDSTGLENSPDWQKLFERDLLAAPKPVRQVLSQSLGGWAEVA